MNIRIFSFPVFSFQFNVNNTDGTWFYENQLWTGTEDEITWAITKKCGTRGVHTGGTKKEVLRAVDDTVAFFKTHLK